MAAGAVQRPAPRKRNRKRKRRNVSSSSESSDISDSSDSEIEKETTTVKLAQKRPAAAAVAAKASSASGSSSRSSSESEENSSSDSDSDSSAPSPNAANRAFPGATTVPKIDNTAPQPSFKPTRKPRAPSPAPLRDVPAPNILDTDEGALRSRFRQFWLGSIADGFADDLNEIRKEPNMTPARLSLLIDSLAAGADVYASSSGPDGKQTNEMEIVLGE